MATLKRLCAVRCANTQSLACLRRPTSLSTLIQYVAGLHEEGLAPSTIASHLSAINLWHQMHNWESPTQHVIIQKMLIGARHLHSQPQLRMPITPSILRTLLHTLRDSHWHSFTKQLYMAMYTLAFYAFLRVGEMTASLHTLMRADCSIHPASLHITFRSYKFSRGAQTSLIIPATNHDLCPHSYLR